MPRVRSKWGLLHSETKPGYRDGHDRPRSIASNRGPITIRRPRVRGARFGSEALPRHRRRLRSVDRSITELWLDGLATRDFEGTLRAFCDVSYDSKSSFA